MAFTEWAQNNEVSFNNVWFSDKAHFDLDGVVKFSDKEHFHLDSVVNKQNV
jgi:hypothetical protein